MSPICRAPRVVGISKLARVVDAYAKRFQIQEKMTAQIANTIDEVLQPRGVAVIVEAQHQCMSTRGVHKPGTSWSPAACSAPSATTLNPPRILAMISPRSCSSVEG